MNRLPLPLTTFIGREAGLAEVRALAAAARLLTFTGAGGSGKTRLALELARRLAEEGREVRWVELASLAEAAQLAIHVALALDIRVEGAASAEHALAARLAERAPVLVLDNCEHVVDETARLVTALLAACPQLQVVATSREALGVGGERSWLVPPMALPARDDEGDLGVVAASEAVRLFVARAEEASRTFALTEANRADVLRICRRLDGLPLALELAAARVAVLTPAQIATRLDDRFALLVSGTRGVSPRQRTLRGAVDWSYDLLAEDERRLLERLSAFAGGFTLEAVEAVCADEVLPAGRLLDLLAALATKSLVALQEDGGAARYHLLETIREYAVERRRARGDALALEARHAAHYLGVARALEPELLLGRPRALRAIDVEHDNLLAALAWSARARAGTQAGLPLTWALLWYWFHRQLWPEGYAQAARALDTADGAPPALRAAAQHALGLFGLYQRQPGSAERLAEAQRLWREAGIERWQAFTRLVETVAASLRQDVAAATAFATDMLAIAERQPDPWDGALAKAHGMVPVLVWQRRWDEASRLLDEALAVYRARDYAIGVAYVLDAQAFVALMLDDVPRAMRLAAASLREEPLGENRWLAGRSLRILGAAAARHGDVARAVRLFAAADAMYEAIGAASLTAERAPVNALPAQLRATMPEAAFHEAWEAGRALDFREAVALALEGVEGDATGPGDASPRVVADAPALDAPALEVRALGRLEIRCRGVELPAAAWPYAKPRELLVYLLAHPDGRTREQVGLDFWPEISAAQVKNNFHVTLHHLRKAVGDAALIRFERGRYRVAAAPMVLFDVTRFEAQVTAALRQLRTAPADLEAGASLAEALAWHRAPFLEEESFGDWHLSWRDRLARLHEDGLSALAAHHEARGDAPAAAAAYRALVALDPLHEAAVRGLMASLARAGRRSEAAQAYERLARALQAELEGVPEPATTALAGRIARGESP